MKNKIHKILGIGLTLMLALALVGGFALPAGAAVEKLNEWYKFEYPVPGELGGWFMQDCADPILHIGPMARAINGDVLTYVWIDANTDDDNNDLNDSGENLLFKSTDDGRSWAATNYHLIDLDPTTTPIDAPEQIVDLVCSSIDEDIIYVTDGNYVFKTTDNGDTWIIVGRDSLETILEGACGLDITNTPITCLDVGYGPDDAPYVFIGVDYTDISAPSAGEPSVIYINEEGYPAMWTDLQLHCWHGNGGDGNYIPYSIGVCPDFVDTKKTMVVVSTDVDGIDTFSRTYVVSTVGYPCSWSEVSQLLMNCVPANYFEIREASRIAFPDDWEDTETLFVGVTGDSLEFGGDVYMATVTSPVTAAIDMNVAGIVSGCVGKMDATNIISLDICGDTDSASLIAGVWGYVDGGSPPHDFNEATDVYCSEDGGWSWDVSAKDPTGGDWDGTELAFSRGRVEVIWLDCPGSALAGTRGCEAAVSLNCDGDYACEFFNQISLIGTCIDCVIWGDHSPEYLSDASSTMYLLTECYDCCPDIDNGGDVDTQSLFRHDGTYWERVFCSTISGSDYWPDTAFEMVEVSPDFDETSVVYLFNYRLEGWRTTDAGCSWNKLTFPCAPRPYVSAGIVVDEDTVIAGGSGPDDGWIFKTTRHGVRPWKAYEMSTTIPDGNAVSFDLEPGYEDPGYVLYGDDNGRVWLSEDGGETWELVGSGAMAGCVAVLGTDDVWVVFDPGFNTSGDEGENTIYAAAGSVIARCTIDWDEDIVDQEWVKIGGELGDDYLGIEAEGDTALYVTNAACGEVITGARTVTVSGQVSAEWTGEKWEMYMDPPELVQLPLVGVIDLDGKEVTHESGKFLDDELVVHVSDVLTTTGFIKYDVFRAWDMDFDDAYFESEEDGLTGKVYVTPYVEVSAWEYTGNGDEELDIDAHYDPVTLTYTLDEDQYLLFEAWGLNERVTVFAPRWSSWDADSDSDYDTDRYFPMPAVSGTIGVQAPYSGATGDIELVNATVWLPHNVWWLVLDAWDIWGSDTFLEWWLTGVVRNVISTNLITDVTGVGVAGEVESCVLRSLNPLDDVKPTMKVVFERLIEGLDAGTCLTGTCLYGLAITHDVSDEGCDENVLWTLAHPCCEDVWVYEDTTAQPVILKAPLDERKLGVTDEVTLEWAELCGVGCYEVSLFKYCPTCPDEKVAVAIADACPALTPECTTAETCIVIGDLAAGTTYYWQVRACKDHPTLSKWSAERTFLTALGITELVSPACGADSVIISTSFNWTAVTGATSYDIELATTETFTTGVTRGSSTVNAWVIAEPLDYATTYYWRVRAHADGVYSDWVVGIFTTAAKAVPAPPPVVVEPTPPAPVVPTPIIEMPPTPSWVWAIIGIGAALAVVVIVLIVRTRRPPA